MDQLRADEIDALPFGAIHIAYPGETVVCDSQSERPLSGSGSRPNVELNFFGEVAPCMDNESYHGRIAQPIARGTAHVKFTHIGDFEARDLEFVREKWNPVFAKRQTNTKKDESLSASN